MSVLILMGCSESLDVQLEPEVTVYFSDDSEQRLSLTSADNEYAVLNEWLQEHNSDWYPTSGRYPGGVYIKSGRYGIQITKIHIVLYSTTSSEPKAIYVQQIARNELSEIKNLGK